MRKSMAAGIGFAAIAVLGVGACSPGDESPIVQASGTGSSGSSGAVPTTEVQETGVNEPPALQDGAQSVLLDVVPAACETGPGDVTASGTVTNRTEEVRDIVVTVSWTSPDNLTTYAKSSAVLAEVPAGATQGYQILSKVEPPSGSAVICSFSALSGTLAG